MTSLSGIDGHAEAPLVISGLRLAQAGDAAACGVTVRVGLARDLAELVDDVLGRRAVGIAHAEIDDVLAARPGRGLHRVHFGEDIGRQALNAVEIRVHGRALTAMLRCINPCMRASDQPRRDRRPAQREAGGDGHGAGNPAAMPARLRPTNSPGGKRRGSHVKLGPQQDRRLSGKHVADDPADTGGENAHGEGRNGRHPVSAAPWPRHRSRKLRGPAASNQSKRRPAKPAAAQQPDDQRGGDADQQGGVGVDPEDRRADQQVAQRAAADAGDDREEDEGHERLALLGREQRARNREHGDPEIVEHARGRTGFAGIVAWRLH